MHHRGWSRETTTEPRPAWFGPSVAGRLKDGEKGNRGQSRQKPRMMRVLPKPRDGPMETRPQFRNQFPRERPTDWGIPRSTSDNVCVGNRSPVSAGPPPRQPALAPRNYQSTGNPGGIHKAYPQTPPGAKQPSGGRFRDPGPGARFPGSAAGGEVPSGEARTSRCRPLPARHPRETAFPMVGKSVTGCRRRLIPV